MDDRPATDLFPQQTAAICGAQLIMPPPALLGHFTQPGDADGLVRWLLGLDTTGVSALVVSSDMLAYGGLVASRTAATPLADARTRIAALARFHELHPTLPIYAFGTIMRLTPTETPQSEPYLDALAAYARLAGAPHPTPDQAAQVAQDRAKIPDGAYWDYIGARVRDVDTDESLITLAAQGGIAWLSITQDDAGSPDGVQISEQTRLRALISELGIGDRVIVSSGADEMGMVAVTRAVEDAVDWHPTADIAWSDVRGPNMQDPLEDVSVGQTVDNLYGALKTRCCVGHDDFYLDIFVPQPAQEQARWAAAVASSLHGGPPTAVVDLTFIDDDITEERRAFEALIADKAAALPAAFASWNTTANSVGTAMAAGACSAIAAHFRVDTEQARMNFLFDRYVDDYAYRLLVRPGLNADLRAKGYDTYSLAAQSSDAQAEMRRRLWPLAIDIFDGSFAPDGWTQSELGLYLPWQRTFEVRVESRLTRSGIP